MPLSKEIWWFIFSLHLKVTSRFHRAQPLYRVTLKRNMHLSLEALKINAQLCSWYTAHGTLQKAP